MSKKHKKHNRRRRQSFTLTLVLFLICIIVIWLLCFGTYHILQRVFDTSSKYPIVIQRETETESETDLLQTEMTEETETETETEVYTEPPEVTTYYRFFQGPKAWSEKWEWSGAWADMELAGSTFGNFGCGLVCMANIYSTYSEYECSPIDMYKYAQEVSDYSPGGGYGAIDWGFMAKTLETCGFSSKLCTKDEYLMNFEKAIDRSWCAIVLVSAYNDNSYWTTTEGHYVVIWDYNKDDHTVYLTDSGSNEHNGSRIPITWVYSALKTSNPYQYMMITNYDPEKNTWKHDGITDQWIAPKSE